jgi:hypothetical protein
MKLTVIEPCNAHGTLNWFDRRALIGAIILVGVTIVASPAYTQEKSIVVASTTSPVYSNTYCQSLNKRPGSP